MNRAFIGFRAKMFIALCMWGVLALPGLGDRTKPKELDVPYEPTHPQVVDAMLKLAKVTSNDYVFDLGCGDGRIVIAAAKNYKARGFGVDLDAQRIRESNESASHEGVTKLVKFEVQDIMVTDIREASVVTLYLLERVNRMLRPKLFSDLRPGTRVVSHAFSMGDWESDKALRHPKARGKFVYFWVMPAPAGGTWRWETKTSGGKIVNDLKLHQEFQAVSGTVGFPAAGRVPIADMSLTGRKLTFTVTTSIQGKKVKIVYTGTVEGDTIQGTQEWLPKLSTTGKQPWTAKRDPVDVTGAWQVNASSHPKFNGTLSIQRKGRKLAATYVQDKSPKKTLTLSGFYVWGSSIRFEIPTDGEPLVFTGVLETSTAKGTYIGEGWPVAKNWSAKRLAGK